jgi:hypothetical protein
LYFITFIACSIADSDLFVYLQGDGKKTLCRDLAFAKKLQMATGCTFVKMNGKERVSPAEGTLSFAILEVTERGGTNG